MMRGVTGFRPSDDTKVDFRSWLVVEEPQSKPSLIGKARATSMADWAWIAPEPRIGPLTFERWPFQAPTSESTAGKGLGGLYSEEFADVADGVIMKSTQVGCCLDPDTKVLTADLRWIRIDEVYPGLELVAVDEEPGGGKGSCRRMRKATVEARWDVSKPAFLLTLSDGRQLTATGDHRFLMQERRGLRKWMPPMTRKNGAQIQGFWKQPRSRPDSWAAESWVEVKDARPGEHRIRAILPSTWEEPSYEDGWASGALDGEGSWGRGGGKSMTFTQVPGPVFERMRSYLLARRIGFRESATVSAKSGRPISRLHVQKVGDLMKLIGKTRPTRWPADSAWWDGLKLPSKLENKYAVIEDIKPLGVRRMVDLQTSEATFIAEGFVSHNSSMLWRWAARRADQFRNVVLYIFPTDRHVVEFARERIDPSIQESEYLSRRSPRGVINNAHQKRIGEGWCFGAGTLILTRRGEVPIENIRQGDEVLTHRGRFRPVTAVSMRTAESTRVIQAHGSPSLVTTPDHPFWVREHLGRKGRAADRYIARSEPEWAEASELHRGLYVGQVLPPVIDDDHSEDFWWVVGRYLADGWLSKGTACIYCSKPEFEELRERIERVFKTKWRERAKTFEFVLDRVRPDEWVRPGTADRSLREFLQQFGMHAHGKRLPGFVMGLDTAKSKALADGWLSGDGHYVESKEKWTAGSVSKELAFGMSLVIQRAYGVAPSIHLRKEAGRKFEIDGRIATRQHDFYNVVFGRNKTAFIEDGIAWRKVRRNTEGGSATVWGLEVAEDESYMADHCIVHNCYFRGTTQTRKDKRAAAAQSVSAQAIVFDEYDDLEPATLSQMERRISGAQQSGDKARVRRVGVPTTDGFGIAAAYAMSDQREWNVACRECDTEQVVTWDHVRWTTSVSTETCQPGNDVHADEKDVVKAWRACEGCAEELDVLNGRWLARNPGASSIGFHVSRLIVKDVDLASIVVNSRKTTPFEREAFFQNDLGLPYSSADSGVTREELISLAASAPEMVSSYSGGLPVTMGVDVASARALNVRITVHLEDGKRECLWVGEAEDFSQVVELMDRYNVTLAAIDHAPERRLARDVAIQRPGRVILVRYDDSIDSQPVVYDQNNNMASVNRTEAIDAMLTAVRTGRHGVPRNPPPRYLEHMIALKRKLTVDARNRPVFRYITVGTVGDDYAHAEVYDLAAKEVLAIKWTAEELAPDDPTLLTGGPGDIRLDVDEGDERYEEGFGDD